MTSRNRSGNINNIQIRDATLSDASQIAVLMSQLGYETNRSEMETRLKSILCNPAYNTFVAIMDGCICGMIGTLTYASYEHNDASGRILALVALNKTRRRGIGRALVATAEEDFVQRGIRRVSLDTRLTREDAHKFYESLGYERTGWRFVKQLPVSN
jgi:ribosomal protein S18 acetylase RimI-like enzyme